MANNNFLSIFGYESDESVVNSQDLAAGDSPVIPEEDNTTSLVDRLGETYESNNPERNSGDTDYMPEELKAEIAAIENSITPNEIVSNDALNMVGEDPVHEGLGGVDLANDTDETTKSYEMIKESAAVPVVDVTGVQPDVDAEFRKEYNQEEPDPNSGITAPVETYYVDRDEMERPEDSEEYNEAVEMNKVDNAEVEGNNDSAIDPMKIATESDDMDIESEIKSVENGTNEVETTTEEDLETTETETTEGTDVDTEVTETTEVEETTTTETEEEVTGTECAEEREIVNSIQTSIDENPALDAQEQEEAQSNAEETNINGASALDPVTDMVSVNTAEGNQDPETAYNNVRGEEPITPIETATLDEQTGLADILGGSDESTDGDAFTENTDEADTQTESEYGSDEEESNEDDSDETYGADEEEDTEDTEGNTEENHDDSDEDESYGDDDDDYNDSDDEEDED